MKVTNEGTTNIIRWYQPENSEECKSTDCMKCVYYSYIPSSSSCPFEAWMINHPVEKPKAVERKSHIRITNPYASRKPECLDDCKSILCLQCVYDRYNTNGIPCSHKRYLANLPVEKSKDTGESIDVLQNQQSAQDILDMCASLQANTMQMQLEPLEDMVKVLDLIIEITEKQDELTEMRQEQPATEEKQDSVQQVQARRYQEYTIDQHIVKADDIKVESIYIPNDAILTRHLILTPSYFNSEQDLAHVITWLTPVK